MPDETTTTTQYPQDALARQILTDGFLKEPSGYINGNLSGAFGFAGITPDQISPETLALAQHCGLTHTGDAVWTYDSADDQRTPDEIAAVRASIAAAEAPASTSSGDAPAAGSGNGSTEAPQITHEDQLQPASPAPSTEHDTHVLVPNDHVSFLHKLVDALERGEQDVEGALVRAFRRVFPRAA